MTESSIVEHPVGGDLDVRHGDRFMSTGGQKRTADIGHSFIHPLTYSGSGEACLEVASAVPASSRD
jgi:hypothetical protein